MNKIEEMTSEELIKKVWEEELVNDRFGREVGVDVLEIRPGYCKAELKIEKRHLNPFNMVHGGCIYTMADTVAGIASASAGGVGPTVSGDMYFLRPTMGTEKIIAEAEVLKHGRRMKVIDVKIYNDSDKLIAKSTLQYMHLEKAYFDHHQ